jgi:hypothetical protein
MTPLGLSIALLLALVVLFASRSMALLGMLAGVLYLTQAQQIDVLGFNLFAIRFLELAGFVRVMARREFSFSQLNRTDQALLLLYSFTAVVYCLRGGNEKTYVIGQWVDAFLCYFTFRGLISDMDDLRSFLRSFLILLAPYTLLILTESVTGHNPFTVLGGMDGGSAWMRHGYPRCFGSFRQPDTLGMFVASFLPLYMGLACIARERKRAVLGICLCLIITLAANSGGAACGAVAGLVCWGAWRLRTQMRKVRWGMVAAIAALAVVMKAPIWYLLSRISEIIGGDGWHRSYLLDVSFRHLGLWWLAGMNLIETVDWFPDGVLVTTGAADITNQFLFFGFAAGLGAVALLTFLLVRAFSGLGKALAGVRSISQKPVETEFLLWGLGVMLAVHIVNWFDIIYFDQMYVIWFMQLATISSIAGTFLATATRAGELAQPATSFDMLDSETELENG